MAASSSVAKPPKLVAPTLSDFEQVYEVVPNQGTALQRLPIADIIYQKSHAPDLSDLYLFNAEKKILSSQLFTEYKKQPRSSIRMDGLNFYVLQPEFIDFQNNRPQLEDFVQITYTPQGQVQTLSIQQQPIRENQEIKSILIDNRNAKDFLSKIALQVAIYENIFIPIQIYTSENLKDWRLIQEDVIYRLQKDNVFINDTLIELATPERSPFLLIVCSKPGKWSIDNIAGEFHSEFQPELQLLNKEIKPEKIDENLFRYDLSRRYPITKINFKLPPNTILLGELGVKTKDKKTHLLKKNRDKTQLYFYDSVVAYQLTHQDKILKNEALYFQTQEKELYLQTRLGPNELAPPLIIWYYPQYLLFVGEGSPPYHLGVGLKPGNWLPPPEIPLPLLETTANEIPVVKLGISTDQNLPPKTASGSPVSQKVFWVILGLGLVLMIGLIIKLTKEIRVKS